MALEIERKFLVVGDFTASTINSYPIRQGYISSSPGRTVRIRITHDKAFLTIKGASDDQGLSRYEFEQPLSMEDAEQLFLLCEPGAIDKVRHHVAFDGKVWEVDRFHGANEGLVIAEIELNDLQEAVTLPPWVGKEVTGDRRYYNSQLTKHPYTRWDKP